MALMTWNNNYSVGVATMDGEHRKWFGILNELHEAMLAGKAREIQQRVMVEMVAYTHSHFASEEALLSAKSYSNLAEHRQKHAKFSAQVREMQSKMESGESVLTVEVMDSLKQWLNSHILTEDMKYGAWIRAK